MQHVPLPPLFSHILTLFLFTTPAIASQAEILENSGLLDDAAQLLSRFEVAPADLDNQLKVSGLTRLARLHLYRKAYTKVWRLCGVTCEEDAQQGAGGGRFSS
eukprot:362011-Chlamydomonas_euryale.AAC.10